jgi:hypothetical protein
MSLPPAFCKPVIKRPEWDARVPKLHLKRQSVIRGSTGRRCQFCSALLPLDDEQCTACGATQIDVGLIDLKEAPAWRKRIKNLGGPPIHGYRGT